MQRRTLVPVSTAATMATIVAAVTMVAIVATVATDASIRLVADVSTNFFFLTVVSGSSRLINNYVSYDGYDYGGYDVGHLSVICCVSRTVFGGHLSVVRRSSIGEQLTDSRSTVGRCVDEGRLIGSWSTVHQWLTGGGTTNRPLVNARHSVMAISRHRGSERPRTVAIVRTWSSELRSIPGSKVDPKVDPIQTR